jgi:hypothetical protein
MLFFNDPALFVFLFVNYLLLISIINDLVSNGILNKEISNNLTKELTCVNELGYDHCDKPSKGFYR